MRQLVSVIIPVFNVMPYLKKSVYSVLNQTHAEIEIILIDNGSTDGSFQLMQEFEREYPGKIRLSREPKKGAPAARNRGLEMARGNWFQFLDADDYLLPTKIEHQLRLAEKAKGPLIVNGAYSIEDEQIICDRFPSERTDDLKSVFLGETGVSSSLLFDKQLKKSGPRWDNNWASSQDNMLLFDCVKMGFKLIYDPALLTVKKQRTSGMISQQSHDIISEARALSRASQLRYFRQTDSELSKDREVIAVFAKYLWYFARKDAKLAFQLYRELLKDQATGNIWRKLKIPHRLLIRTLGVKRAFELKNRIKKGLLSNAPID